MMASPSASPFALTNKSVWEHLENCGKNHRKTARLVTSILSEHNIRANENSIRTKISKLRKTYKTLNSRKRDIPKLQAFMNSKFTVKHNPTESTSPDPVQPTPMIPAISTPDDDQSIVSGNKLANNNIERSFLEN